MAPVENSYAAADSQGIGFSIDIGGLDAKMQAGAIFTGTEYKDGTTGTGLAVQLSRSIK